MTMAYRELSVEYLRANPLPLHKNGDGKDARGRVLVISGNARVPGAAILAGVSALRSGAGILQIATSASVAPYMKAAIRSHLAETKEQISRLERLLADLGEDNSTLKDTDQSLVANVTALFHSAAPDEILKNTFANNAFENFEIAAYVSLIALSQQAGQSGAKGILDLSLAEEQRMADWVRDNVGKVTLAYVGKATS